EETDASDAESWVALDGRWRSGSLQGSFRKEAPVYLGAAARERERERKLMKLAQLLLELERERAEKQAKVATLDAARAGVEQELAAFPLLNPVLTARALLLERQRRLELERSAHRESEQRWKSAEEALRAALLARNQAAAERGLSA